VVSLAVFGSVVINESTAQSDIDLLVEFDRDVGLFDLFEIQHRLEEIIGVQKVDLIQKGATHPALREHILSEAVNVAYIVEASHYGYPRIHQKDPNLENHSRRPTSACTMSLR
jgi:hypothetical protein